MESAWETNLRETTKATRGYVFDRDGHLCWMCGSHDKLEISHQIAKAAHESFSRFQANGTIPLTVIGVSHHDNLFPLCKKCHASFNSAFPDWVLIPDEKTIQKYIDHEIDDYEKRTRALTSQSLSVPRSLPLINRKDIRYQPLIINNSYNLFLGYQSPKWPKPWMGEPTTVIHRASRRGLFESTQIQTFRLPGKGPARFWQTGVPEAFRILVAELINLWARQPPKRSG